MRRIERLAQDIAQERYRNIRALFLRQGARPPFLLWSPRETDLALPPLLDLLRWWEISAERKPMSAPIEDDIGRAAASYLIVVEPVEDGRDFVYRHVGPALLRIYGHVSPGRLASSLEGPDAPFAGAVYRAVMLRRQPILTVHEPSHLLVSQTDRLIVPLFGPGGAVDRLVAVNVPEEPLRTLVDVVMDAVLAFDETGRIRLANSHAAALLGIAEEELAGRMLSEVLQAGFIAAGLKDGASLVTAAREATARRADGGTLPVEVSIGQTRRGRRRVFLAVLRDLTARKAEEDRVRALALTDPLTGLANRALFYERFDQALRRAHRTRSRLALILVDLDGFKAINDRFGHPAGDLALQTFARRVRAVTRETDVFARLGGDEFALVQTDLHQPEAATVLARRLLKVLEEPIDFDGERLSLRASLGVAVYPQNGETIELLTENADRVLYQAKRRGGSQVMFFRTLEG